MKKIFIIAAENSAETYGADIVKKFKENKRDIEFIGIGGDKFEELGVKLIAHRKELSIVGIIEVIKHLFKIFKIKKSIINTIKSNDFCCAILIDFPDFNLSLAKKLKKLNIPVYYYISPTVWAWRYNRVKTIKKYIKHIFIIFPFEIKIFEREEIDFTYAGHPLLNKIKPDVSREEFREKLKLNKNDFLITLLPGSRESEIKNLLPVMIEALKLLKKEIDFKSALLKADNIDNELINELIKNFDIKIISQKDNYNLINSSDFIITTCGTSNLESAILKKPFIAIYKVNPLTYYLGKPFLKTSIFSIVNILLGKNIVPELIQKNMNSKNIRDEALKIIKNRSKNQDIINEFDKLKSILKSDSQPADIIYNTISKKENL